MISDGVLDNLSGVNKEEQMVEIINNINVKKPASIANVDFYSGFVYTMLGIPEEMFTPMFATSRISPISRPSTYLFKPIVLVALLG